MEYQEFVEKIKQKVTEQAEEGSKVSVSRILKNNLEPVDGLTILHQGENVARAIWLNPLYQKYEYGIPVERIAEEILEYHKKERQEGVCDLSFYTDFSKVQDHIACKLVHYGMNRTLLEEVPHRAFLDLAVVYYYRVEDERFGNASILVKNDHMRIWHTDPETLHALAMRNTPRLLPYELTDILELIRQISNVDPGMIRQISNVDPGMIRQISDADPGMLRQISNADPGMLRQDSPMYVLTNAEKSFGASAILFPAILQAVRARLQSDYYVLPSSIHECIIIPSDEQLDPEALHEMVKEINEEHVAPEELLGDSVYRYSQKRQRLEIVFSAETIL